MYKKYKTECEILIHLQLYICLGFKKQGVRCGRGEREGVCSLLYYVPHLLCFLETHIKRQATRHDCLPSLLSDGDKWIEIVYSKENNIFGRLKQPRQDKNLLYRHEEPSEPTKEGPLSFVLFESPFASVSTVSRCLSGASSSLCVQIPG